MTALLGQIALVCAGLASMAQAFFSFYGAHNNNMRVMRKGRVATALAFAMTGLAFFDLMFAHVTDNFSILNVVSTSHTNKPLLYKITGVWASHEGSMILWVLMLTAFGFAMARMGRGMPDGLRARALGVQGLMGVGFFAFIIFLSNPFLTIYPAPLQGMDLNPILQDPGLAFHPPFLYLGYVGFSSVFSLAAAMLLGRRVESAWITHLRPFALLAWGGLTCGIALGSFWAYYELGWGGWWFWDPVENAALLPWLVGTALIHSLIVSYRRKALMRWTILLSLITFGLSVLGTFLVRSGLLTSVHSFAVDPWRGIFILILLGLVVGGAFLLYGLRAHKLPATPALYFISRENALLLNNVFLCCGCSTLLVGTLYPLILDAIGGGKISVGAPYFNIATVPFLMVLLALMVFGPMMRWRQDNWRAILPHFKYALLVVIVMMMVWLYLEGVKGIMGAAAFVLGFWVVAGSMVDILHHGNKFWINAPRFLAHIGLGIMVMGMGGSVFGTQHIWMMKPGNIIEEDGYRVEFSQITAIKGKNYDALQGLFYVWQDGDLLATMKPSVRFYIAQGGRASEVAIHTNPLRDLYMVMTVESGQGTKPFYTIKFLVNPLMMWGWIGAGLMGIGGFVGFANLIRRRRK